MERAPMELVEPVKKLVSVAIEKLGDDYTYPRNVRRFSFSQGSSHIEFLINNLHQDGALDWVGDQGSSGLFITVEEYEFGKLVRREELQAPCNPEMVTQKEIYLLRGYIPDSVVETAAILQKAVPVVIIEGDFSEVDQTTFRLTAGN
ncbi:MAG: hypothetical protein Q8L37_05235 [Candidatus Gottesmanbacteria bacterium]|nr:hypothetical protein [Candidatus Gottesmanbacteria bacterium]